MLHLMRSTLLVSAMLASGFAVAQETALTPQQPAPVAAAATVEAAASPAAAATVQTAAAPAATQSGLVAAPPEGKGQIVFFREKKFAGSAVRYKVREGEQELGKLSSGVYFVHVTEPGTHEYTVHSEAKDILTLEVEPGETYYVQGDITMGVLMGRPNLSPKDAATFESMSAKLKPAK